MTKRWRGPQREDPLTPAEKAQLQLPLRLGGYGLPSQRALADCAWLGSWLQCLAPVTRASSVLRGLGTSCTALNTTLRCAEAALAAAGVSLWDATTANGEGSWEATEDAPVLKGQALAAPSGQGPPGSAAAGP